MSIFCGVKYTNVNLSGNFECADDVDHKFVQPRGLLCTIVVGDVLFSSTIAFGVKLEQLAKGYSMRAWWCLLDCLVTVSTLCYGEMNSN
jgi:hypothetical protein